MRTTATNQNVLRVPSESGQPPFPTYGEFLEIVEKGHASQTVAFVCKPFGRQIVASLPLGDHTVPRSPFR